MNHEVTDATDIIVGPYLDSPLNNPDCSISFFFRTLLLALFPPLCTFLLEYKIIQRAAC